jgi:[FeFe] hydrogenase H-cluster maturation GTPase HydF
LKQGKTKDNKIHIGIYGRRNYGKSSLINLLAGQQIAIVSNTPGTTTDPVKKSIEIKGIGPCIMIDTAGIDDTGELGKKRIAKTSHTLEQIDIAILMLSGNQFGKYEKNVIQKLKEYEIPYCIIHNKSDITPLDPVLQKDITSLYKVNVIDFSVKKKTGTDKIINELIRIIPDTLHAKKTLIGDLIQQGDTILLVTPIDVAAPEGRLILPQVQVIRDILDNDAIAIVTKERELDSLLTKIQPKPVLVVTDSQVFLKVDASIPKDIPLTSFSIVLARLKGNFEKYIEGTSAISGLKSGDKVLLLESCTHLTSCDDIGRVKIPRWIDSFTGQKLHYDVVAGLDNPPHPIQEYALIIQCGGCVITSKQLKNRLKPAIDANIPVSNYGMAIAYVQGIFNRAVAPFTKIEKEDYL